MRYLKKGTLAAKSAKNIYLSPVLSFVIGGAVVFSADLSVRWIIICGSLIAFQIIYLSIGYIRDKHLDKKWHALTNHVFYNVVALFCWFPFWIVTGMKIWLFITLLSVYLLFLIIGYQYHRIIAIGIFSSKQNQFGKVFSIVVTIWMVLSGGGSYGYTKMLQQVYGYSNTVVIISALMVPFTYILIFVAHGLWVRVKDPAFDYHEDIEDDEHIH